MEDHNLACTHDQQCKRKSNLFIANNSMATECLKLKPSTSLIACLESQLLSQFHNLHVNTTAIHKVNKVYSI